MFVPPLAYITIQKNSIIRIIDDRTIICGTIENFGLMNGGRSEIINAHPLGLAIAVIKPCRARVPLSILSNFVG